MAEHEERPVLSGLVALVAVAAAVGLVLGLAALAGTRVLGLGEGSGSVTAASEQSMYLPRPTDISSATGPLITLPAAPEEPGRGGKQGGGDDDRKQQRKKKADKPEKRISLSAGQLQVAPMEQIDLTGTYPGGEGAVVEVQVFENGEWTDFAGVDAVVTNETFHTWIQTGRVGQQRFRVVDTDTGLASNPVRVTIG